MKLLFYAQFLRALPLSVVEDLSSVFHAFGADKCAPSQAVSLVSTSYGAGTTNPNSNGHHPGPAIVYLGS